MDHNIFTAGPVSPVSAVFPLLLVLMIWGLPGSASAADHTTDSLDTVKQKVKDQQALLVDVRETKEWDEGHLAEARLSPLSLLQNEAELTKQLKNLPKDKIIYCHCRSGRRCLTAADILKKQGYDVRPLKAGYEDLLKAGFPQAKGK